MDVSAETKYKRFLHYASEDGIYIPGCRFHFKNYSPERLTSLDTLVSEGKEDFVIDTILKIHNDKTSAYPEALVFALVQCTGRAFRRVVRNWYLSKTALDLADIVTWRPKYKGWRHADTIKLAHVTSSDPAQGAVLRYVSRGLKDTLEKYGGIPEAEEVLKHLSEVDAFRKETDPASVTRMKLELESKTGITREPPTICGELLKSLEKVFRSTFKNKLPWLSEDKERWNFHMNKTGMVCLHRLMYQIYKLNETERK
ncbi:hypothetical protein AAG570_008864 [Ranatra chinensis]|uniref:TROVE domain-containing protein n=1 Tax=Ranatra chinensis TaxID=642074 RepID=A0ABD0Z509_9HEMI